MSSRSTRKPRSWRFNREECCALSAGFCERPSLRSVRKINQMSILTKIKTLRHVRPAAEPDLPDVAHSVAIIMDGNARWARKRGLPIAAGHRAGTKALRRTVEAAIDLGVDSLAVYAFSTENWSRPPEEVELLMEIFTETIEREVDEETFASYLNAPEMPDPDLLIRTSGELRISNFLLWQLAYAELVFVDTLWPDFGEEHLRAALDDYASRRRRFGGR